MQLCFVRAGTHTPRLGLGLLMIYWFCMSMVLLNWCSPGAPPCLLAACSAAWSAGEGCAPTVCTDTAACWSWFSNSARYTAQPLQSCVTRGVR